MGDGSDEDNGFEDLAQQVIKYIDETYPEKNFTFKVMARRCVRIENYPKNTNIPERKYTFYS